MLLAAIVKSEVVSAKLFHVMANAFQIIVTHGDRDNHSTRLTVVSDK